MLFSQVGSEVLNKSEAIKEMIQIAGSEDRFFKVSNYAALEKILSSLEKSIYGIEGKIEMKYKKLVSVN